MIIPPELLERFRVLSLERLGRVETSWNRLVFEGGGADDLVRPMLREIHTVKGDAAIVGAHEVAQLCQKLEDLLELAEKRDFEISEDCELVGTMAIQFVGMLLRLKPGAPSGLDLDGFVRQVDDVTREARTLPAPPRRRMPRRTGPNPERNEEEIRARLATAATTVFVEYLSARGVTSRSRLRDAWTTLRRELVRLEVTELDPLIERHVEPIREQAALLGKDVDIQLDLAPAAVSPRVATAIDVAVLHLLRNAIDHGIEPPHERGSKPAQGIVHVRTAIVGPRLEIVVEDDGRGIQLPEVRAKAIANGLLDPTSEITEAGLLDLLFAPGFTTKPRVTELSGRGIGMDAVRTAITRVGGQVRIETSPTGTRVTATTPTVMRQLPVHRFTAPNGVAIAISARWTASIETVTDDAVDPLHLLQLAAAKRPTSDVAQPSRDLGLCLRWGFLDCKLRASSEPQLMIAERICPTPDDYPLEIVTVDGQETLLVRPEHVLDLSHKRGVA
jgi:two-component system, chemotaxis family, sensor kinase CheA